MLKFKALMIRCTTKSALVYLILLPALFAFTAIDHNDRFEIVLKNLQDSTLKAKLVSFAQKGIERPVNITNYDTEKVIEYAKTFLGTCHKMNGTTKKGIDCSGLVMVTHKKFGVVLPHSSQAQAHFGKIVPEIDSLKSGDLVFFCHSYNTSDVITHTGIYIGNNRFIHASHKSGVITTNINDPYYWKSKFLFGTRFKQD